MTREQSDLLNAYLEGIETAISDGLDPAGDGGSTQRRVALRARIASEQMAALGADWSLNHEELAAEAVKRADALLRALGVS